MGILQDAPRQSEAPSGVVTSGTYQSRLYMVYMINLYMQKVLF